MKTVFALVVFLISTLASAQSIIWRVDGNFRLLKNQSDQDWLKHVANQSAQLASTQLTIDAISNKWSSIPKNYYDKISGSYEAAYAFPKTWRVVVGVDGVSADVKCV